MSKIISIGTALPQFKHEQRNILRFMQTVYAFDEVQKRKLKFLYAHSGIDTRYSVIPDYSKGTNDWKFYPRSENLEPFPSLEQRMAWYGKYAAPLSVDAIRKCVGDKIEMSDLTHLITVSCTGMSAPGLDLQIVELLQLSKNIFRTSVNFMGCYAAIHALKMANAFCASEKSAKVLVVCTELCTLHFQHEPTMDNIASSLLFSDGSAAALITSDDFPAQGIYLKDFYAEVLPKGKKDMAWELSSTGFLMTLSSYVPDLIEADFLSFTRRALQRTRLDEYKVTHWCIHPGGKRILESTSKSLGLPVTLQDSYQVLQEYGNMSSASILFVLDRMMRTLDYSRSQTIFGAGFGPGLTLESFVGEVRPRKAATKEHSLMS